MGSLAKISETTGSEGDRMLQHGEGLRQFMMLAETGKFRLGMKDLLLGLEEDLEDDKTASFPARVNEAPLS